MNGFRTMQLRFAALATALAMVFSAAPAAAQHAGHTMPMPAEPDNPAAKPKPRPAPMRQAPATSGSQRVDHAAMGHAPQAIDEAVVEENRDATDDPGMAHSATDDSQMGHAGMDHATMDHSKMDHADINHAGMDHGGMAPAPTVPREPIPAVTDADRRAAFPDVTGHTVHDDAIHSYWLLDRLEVWDAEEGTGQAWDAQAWIGTDLDRLWLRSEGERVGGHTEAADLEVFYGRSIARWWDLVAGVRHDFKPGDSQSFAAIGVMGLAPQRFEVEATAYVGERGQTAARFEVEYDLLLTNRLILQPLVEAEFHGKDDPARGVGSGLGTVEAGLRLRYHLRREFAPYIGIVRERAFGTTADYRREDGEDVDDTRFVAGLRIWF